MLENNLKFTDTRSLGNIGEDVACKFLERRDFVIVIRNFRRKWGEIDIVAHRKSSRDQIYNTLHFFEVKSVTTYRTDHSPEENVHSFKARQIKRMIQTYMADVVGGMTGEAVFEFHVLCVYLDVKRRLARVKWLNNIII